MDINEQIEKLNKEITELKAGLAAITDPKHGENTILGKEVFLDPSASLVSNENATISIGDRSNVWKGAQWVGPIQVGNRVFVNQDSYIRPGVVVEDDVSIGPFVRLVTDTHDISSGTRRTGTPRKDPILVKEGSWIGSCAVIMGGVTVGSRSIVAAGSVVTKDVPDNAVVAGVPARVIRYIRDTDNIAELVRVNIDSTMNAKTLGDVNMGKEMLEIVAEFIDFREAVGINPDLFSEEEIETRENQIGEKFTSKLRDFITG